MIPFLLLATQTGPAYPFPRAILVVAKQSFTGRSVRTFTNPAEDLELISTDNVTTEVTKLDTVTGRSTWLWRMKSESQKVDGQLVVTDPKAQPFDFTEIRSRAGAQFSFETGLDEGGGQQMISRLNTLPLPAEPTGIGDTWEFSDSRAMPYIFRGRVLGYENGLYKVKTFFQSTESPKFTANGTAWVGMNGIPTKVEITASPMEIPGGEGPKATLTLIFSLARK